MKPVGRYSVEAVTITSDRSKAISASWDNTLKVWDLITGKEIFTLTGHLNSVNKVVVTPDNSKAISASWDGTYKVWDLLTGKLLFTLAGNLNSVNAIAITPDSQYAICVSGDALKVWDLVTGKEKIIFLGDSIFQCVTFCPNNQTIVAGDASGIVHFLRIEELTIDKNKIHEKSNK
jgi:WD40 repeat protein